MRQHREPRDGEGTAWLSADSVKDDYLCFWYVGPNDARLAEQDRVATEALAVAWGRARTTRVRIRTGEGRTYWAGTARMPKGFSFTWSDPSTRAA